MRNALIYLFGWRAAIWHGDPPHVDRFRWLKKHLLPGPVRTLDAGCGSGAFSFYCALLGNEVVGISFDAANNEIARSRAKILCIPQVRFLDGDLRHLDQMAQPVGSFDQILCLETIEHIQDDRKLLRDLAALLKPGGRLLLTTPFKHHRPLWAERLSETEEGGHRRFGYTHEEVEQLFNECGLRVTVKEYVSGFISQQLTNLMRILSRISPPLAWLGTFPLRILILLDPLLRDLLHDAPLCIGVVGVKGSAAKPRLGSSGILDPGWNSST